MIQISIHTPNLFDNPNELDGNQNEVDLIISKVNQKKYDIVTNQQIATLAQKYFNKIQDDCDENKYLKLANALKEYNIQYSLTKSFSEALAFYLGVKDTYQKSIEEIYDNSMEIVEEIKFTKWYELIVQKRDDERIEIESKSEHEQLRHYIYGIIESSKIKLKKEYYQTIDSSPILWYLNNLKTFFKSMNNDYSDFEKQKVQNLISDYEFTYKMDKLFNRARTYLLCCICPCFKTSILINMMINQIQDRISALEKGERLVLPGGNKDHAVLYVIKKTSNDKFQFKVINSGGGSNIVFPMLMSKDGSRFYGTDVYYDNLPRESISKGLFNQLIKNGALSESMHDNYKLLNETFKSYGTPLKGRTHKLQTNKSCTFKCIAADIHEYLPERVVRHFKLWANEKELQSLSSYYNTLKSSIFSCFSCKGNKIKDVESMLEAGEKFLTKRSIKSERTDAEFIV